jgi:hypothetical protein
MAADMITKIKEGAERVELGALKKVADEKPTRTVLAGFSVDERRGSIHLAVRPACRDLHFDGSRQLSLAAQQYRIVSNPTCDTIPLER